MSYQQLLPVILIKGTAVKSVRIIWYMWSQGVLFCASVAMFCSTEEEISEDFKDTSVIVNPNETMSLISDIKNE